MKKTNFYFFFGNISLLILFSCIAVLLTNYQQESVARVLAKTVHNDLISHEFRDAKIIIGNIQKTYFDSIAYMKGDEKIFKLGGTNNVLCVGTLNKIIWKSSTVDSTYYLKFSFNYLKPLLVSLMIWLFSLSLTTLLLVKEKKRQKILFKKKVIEERKNAFAEAMGQVAHDLRSPLAALDMIKSEINIPEDYKKIFNSCLQRIENIADDVLKKRKESKHTKNSLNTDIKLIINEKNIKKEIVIFDQSADFFEYVFDQTELMRALSNILNNAIEASPRKVQVQLQVSREGFAVVKIEDFGEGIPEEILCKLGDEQVSLGKKNGNGLGVYHCKQFLDSIGGELVIHSSTTSENSGTVVELHFPALLN